MEINVKLVNQFIISVNGFSVDFIERKKFMFFVSSGNEWDL